MTEEMRKDLLQRIAHEKGKLQRAQEVFKELERLKCTRDVQEYLRLLSEFSMLKYEQDIDKAMDNKILKMSVPKCNHDIYFYQRKTGVPSQEVSGGEFKTKMFHQYTCLECGHTRLYDDNAEFIRTHNIINFDENKANSEEEYQKCRLEYIELLSAGYTTEQAYLILKDKYETELKR